MNIKTKSEYDELVNYSVRATKDNKYLVFQHRTIDISIIEKIYTKYIGIINESNKYHCKNCCKEVTASIARDNNKRLVLKCSLCKKTLMKAHLRFSAIPRNIGRVDKTKTDGTETELY